MEDVHRRDEKRKIARSFTTRKKVLCKRVQGGKTLFLLYVRGGFFFYFFYFFFALFFPSPPKKESIYIKRASRRVCLHYSLGATAQWGHCTNSSLIFCNWGSRSTDQLLQTYNNTTKPFQNTQSLFSRKLSSRRQRHHLRTLPTQIFNSTNRRINID